MGNSPVGWVSPQGVTQHPPPEASVYAALTRPTELPPDLGLAVQIVATRHPLAMQRRLLGDRCRWRTVGRIDGLASAAMEQAARLAALCEPMDLRLVIDDREQAPIAAWSREAGWRAMP